jgi:hypothetical protein
MDKTTIIRLHKLYHLLSLIVLALSVYCFVDSNPENNAVAKFIGGVENLSYFYAFTLIICISDLALGPILKKHTRESSNAI